VEQLFDRMANDILNQLDFHTEWVAMHKLVDDKSTRTEAASAAAEAALILFAIDPQPGPSDSVKRWIEKWLPAKRAQTSAIALIDHPWKVSCPGDGKYYDYLKQAAQRGGMKFLCRQPDVNGPGANPFPTSRPQALCDLSSDEFLPLDSRGTESPR
jgi:hypothetical protein